MTHGKRNWKVVDISFPVPVKAEYPNSSIVYLASPVDRFNESGKRVKLTIDINELSDQLKSFLRAEEFEEFGKSLDYWRIKDGELFKSLASKVFNDLGKLVNAEYQNNEAFSSMLNQKLDGSIDSIVKYRDEEADRQKEEEQLEKDLSRPSEEEPEFVSQDDNKISFVHWFRGKNNQRYKLTGAKFDAHVEDASFDYEYGSAHGVKHDYSIEIDDITWYYVDPDGKEGEVSDDDTEKEIGFKKFNNKFKNYIIDWFTRNTNLGSDMRTDYVEW